MIPYINKKTLPIIGLGLLAVLLIVLFNISLSAKKETLNLRGQLKEIEQLKDDFLVLKYSVDAVESKRSLSKVQGIVQAVDDISQSLGLGKKVKSVKSTGAQDRKYAVEEEAEVQIEKIGLNELINILYKIENAPMILSVKKTSIKTSFDNPALFNLTLTLGLITPK